MFLKSLELKNFRNYYEVKLNFKTNKTLLIGKNAQGKTNLLEAIHYLSSLNSVRAKTDSELIKWNEEFCAIKAEILRSDTEVGLECIINPPKKKILKVNGISKNKGADFIRVLSAVNFSVSDLLLLRGVPDDRRKWLDLAISQIYPAYTERLSKYNKIRIQKNNYLKELKGNINDTAQMLDIWNSQLMVAAANIVYLRLKFLKEIEAKATVKHSEIMSNETLRLDYITSIFEGRPELSPEEISSLIEKKLYERRTEEIIRAQSLVGPHRDDISFFINNIESRKFASQGQQRTIVLALKLAELELIKEKTEHTPVLLLDDVLAELDNNRQNYLLNAIGDEIQTVITSVDTLHFAKEFLNGVTIYRVNDCAISLATQNASDQQA